MEGARVHWLCPACGGELTFNKEAAEGGVVDGRGQGKSYQYVFFFELPWNATCGLRIFCAKAAAPSEVQQQQLNVLKLIAALGGLTMKPGIQKTLVDMIVETNEGFDKMMHSSFPRKEILSCTQYTSALEGWRSRGAVRCACANPLWARRWTSTM